MTTEQQIQELANTIGIDASSVRWLADYISRETPEGHEDLINDPDWIQACAKDWLRMIKHMNAKALRHRNEAGRLILDQIK